MADTEDFYEVSRWKVGERVAHREDGRVGVLVQRAAHLYVDRDRKLPQVRWDGRIDAEEVDWRHLERSSAGWAGATAGTT
jgi:hypothetical protein